MLKKYSFFIFLLNSFLLHSNTATNHAAVKVEEQKKQIIYYYHGQKPYQITLENKDNELRTTTNQIDVDYWSNASLGIASALNVTIWGMKAACYASTTIHVSLDYGQKTAPLFVAASIALGFSTLKGLYNITQTGSWFHKITDTTETVIDKNELDTDQKIPCSYGPSISFVDTTAQEKKTYTHEQIISLLSAQNVFDKKQ